MILSPLVDRTARAAVLGAVLCAVVACATDAGKSDTQRRADREVAERVQSALNADDKLYARHIFVRADGGVVHLSGYVWDPPDLLEARHVAELVQGVTKVVNDLELQRNGMDNNGVTR
jgi:osmotically-inducible protein OsmY